MQTIWPNLIVQQQSNTLAMRQLVPRGVGEFELHWTYFGYETDDEAMTTRRLRQANLMGPAGLVSIDDSEVMRLAQLGADGRQRPRRVPRDGWPRHRRHRAHGHRGGDPGVLRALPRGDGPVSSAVTTTIATGAASACRGLHSTLTQCVSSTTTTPRSSTTPTSPRGSTCSTRTATYTVAARENVERGLPLATIRCDSRDMLADRIDALVSTQFHARRITRHVITAIRPVGTSTVTTAHVGELRADRDASTAGRPTSTAPARTTTSSRRSAASCASSQKLAIYDAAARADLAHRPALRCDGEMTMAALRPIDFDDLDPALQRRRCGRATSGSATSATSSVCMAHQPDALLHFDRFTEECKRALARRAPRSSRSRPRPASATTTSATSTSGLRSRWANRARGSPTSNGWRPDDPDTGLDSAERAIQGFVLASIDTLVPPVPGTHATASADAFAESSKSSATPRRPRSPSSRPVRRSRPRVPSVRARCRPCRRSSPTRSASMPAPDRAGSPKPTSLRRSTSPAASTPYATRSVREHAGTATTMAKTATSFGQHGTLHSLGGTGVASTATSSARRRGPTRPAARRRCCCCGTPRRARCSP